MWKTNREARLGIRSLSRSRMQISECSSLDAFETCAYEMNAQWKLKAKNAPTTKMSNDITTFYHFLNSFCTPGMLLIHFECNNKHYTILRSCLTRFLQHNLDCTRRANSKISGKVFQGLYINHIYHILVYGSLASRYKIFNNFTRFHKNIKFFHIYFFSNTLF